MSREIKFEIKLRRKDGTDSYFEYLTLDDLLNRNGSLFHPNIWEIEYKRQFTGLKDKNGVEVYEGDIMSGEFATGHGGKSTKYKVFNCEVHFNESSLGGWRLNHPKKIAPYRWIANIEDSEIIGNIYENPELLKL